MPTTTTTTHIDSQSLSSHPCNSVLSEHTAKNEVRALDVLLKSPVPTLFRPGFHLSSDRGWWASRRPGPNQSLSPPPPPPTMFSSPATVESKYGKSMKESCERVTASSSPIDPTSEGVNMRQTNKSLSNRKPKYGLVNLIKDLCRTRRVNDGLKKIYLQLLILLIILKSCINNCNFSIFIKYTLWI